jgi:protein O-GlcNAc transferase
MTPAEQRFQNGIVLARSGRLDDAIAEFREAARLDPSLAEAHANLGGTLFRAGRAHDAVASLRTAISLNPTQPGWYFNLAGAARQLGQVDEAMDATATAVRIAPNFPPAHSRLGSLLRACGRAADAVQSFRQAIALDPTFQPAWSNLLYTLYYDLTSTRMTILAEHKTWADRFAEPLTAASEPHANDRRPNRRLRIGYVSPNLREHVTGLCFEPVLRSHNRERFEIICYADGNADDTTERLQQYADTWRQTGTLDDAALAKQIREDQVDILIDLNLHMAGSRLLAFARRPAPVQVTYLAYPGTSGMTAIDYAITDVHLDPPGSGSESHYVEKLIRLPRTYWCYRPADACPDVGPLPARSNGYITFGSLNNPVKFNASVASLWAKILVATPGSRLLVLAPGGNAGNLHVRSLFEKAGIPADRLELIDLLPREAYLAAYNRIDIALDPFPYGGHTTSLDALWMGVPVVSLAGTTAVSRAGVTLLRNLGLDELLADSSDRYFEIAVALAGDVDRLSQLRDQLRARMSNSPLTAEVLYARALEKGYQVIWQQWRLGRPPKSIDIE